MTACEAGTVDMIQNEEPVEATRWDGEGDGLHWSDARNWSADQVPTTDAAIEVTGTRVIVDQDLTIAADQKLAITDGVIQIARGVTVTNRGTIEMSAGAIYAGDDSTFRNEGVLGGAGTVARTCGGAIDAGDSPGVTVTDAPCLAQCRTITFDSQAPGTRLADQMASQGLLSISGTSSSGLTPDLATIFDSANPTGNDGDLVTPGYGQGNDTALGHLVILPEYDTDSDGDNLIDDPNDAACGGTIRFDFGCEVSISAVTLVDIEEAGAEVELELFGNSVHTAEAAKLDDNSVQTLDLSGSPAATDLVVHLPGSGAVASMVVCTP
jgi:hypothetical protein